MNERESFLREIVAGRSGAREIFADWLEEQGEGDDAWRWLATPWPRTDAMHELLGKLAETPSRGWVLVSEARASTAFFACPPAPSGFEEILAAVQEKLGDMASGDEQRSADPTLPHVVWKRLNIAGAWMQRPSLTGGDRETLAAGGWIV